jgi:glycerophosphoryl diester phosphodiesterase
MSVPLIVGHRGAKGMAPENTLKAFETGCQYADAVECDIHLTKDKKLVVIHDESIDRTSNGKGIVKELTFDELRKFDFGYDQKIPLLEEVLKLVEKNGKKLVVEVKGDSSQEAEEIGLNLVDFIKNKRAETTISACSFWKEALLPIKRSNLLVSTFKVLDIEFTAEEVLKKIEESLSNGIATVYTFINSDLVSALHLKKYFINAWVVNEPEDIEKIVSLGVDMITTDYPKTVLEHIGSKK